MPRRTADETRALLIGTGLDLLRERGVTAGVQHVRLKDVLDRAGLTTGAAYRIWDDQSAFHHELALAAAGHRDDDPLTRTLSAIRSAVDAGAPIAEVVRLAAAAHIASIDEGIGGEATSTFLNALALRAAARASEDLRAVSRARHQGSIESFTELYAMLLKVYGRRMRPPLTVDHMASAVAAVGEGFALQAIEGEPHATVFLPAEPGRADGPAPGPTLVEWTVFGIALDAIVERFTESIADDEQLVRRADG